MFVLLSFCSGGTGSLDAKSSQPQCTIGDLWLSRHIYSPRWSSLVIRYGYPLHAPPGEHLQGVRPRPVSVLSRSSAGWFDDGGEEIYIYIYLDAYVESSLLWWWNSPILPLVCFFPSFVLSLGRTLHLRPHVFLLPLAEGLLVLTIVSLRRPRPWLPYHSGFPFVGTWIESLVMICLLGFNAQSVIVGIHVAAGALDRIWTGAVSSKTQ